MQNFSNEFEILTYINGKCSKCVFICFMHIHILLYYILVISTLYDLLTFNKIQKIQTGRLKRIRIGYLPSTKLFESAFLTVFVFFFQLN